MRGVLQRVSEAKVVVDGEITGEIGTGILLLLGISSRDTEGDAGYILKKTLGLRIFDDADGKMNLSLTDVNGGLLIVSQFTLYGDSRKGRRPSYIDAADPDKAIPLYEFFVSEARKQIAKVKTGRFQARMEVHLLNDGPVTILLDSENVF